MDLISSRYRKPKGRPTKRRKMLAENSKKRWQKSSKTVDEKNSNSMPKVRPQGHISSMKTYLSPQVVEKIMPFYQRLASDTILERCVVGKTQNSNESLHSCIGENAQKEVFVSKRRLEIAVTDAIEKHNLDYVKSLEEKEDSCLNDSFSLTIAERQDKRRISQNISTKQRKRNATNTNAAYSAGAF
ncbi:uncharacterized protein TNCV_3166461 [Trichonephila clavipes]|uniref:Uncharacterized protein n=1 Tax=Trichonephila clavipes TaxID=2585209 RepID=A0A8X6R9X0_TRICX|nr:uncharacterized protein TNCV_3166461 [Trichonephila clavipes]